MKTFKKKLFVKIQINFRVFYFLFLILYISIFFLITPSPFLRIFWFYFYIVSTKKKVKRKRQKPSSFDLIAQTLMMTFIFAKYTKKAPHKHSVWVPSSKYIYTHNIKCYGLWFMFLCFMSYCFVDLKHTLWYFGYMHTQHSIYIVCISPDIFIFINGWQPKYTQRKQKKGTHICCFLLFTNVRISKCIRIYFVLLDVCRFFFLLLWW